MQVAPRSRAPSAGFMARAWYENLLLQFIPALDRVLVASAREIDVHLELRLAAAVLLGRPAAARGAALPLARQRLDALVAALFGLLQRDVRGARLLDGFVKLRAGVGLLRHRTRCGSDENEGKKGGDQASHGDLSGRIFWHVGAAFRSPETAQRVLGKR